MKALHWQIISSRSISSWKSRSLSNARDWKKKTTFVHTIFQISTSTGYYYCYYYYYYYYYYLLLLFLLLLLKIYLLWKARLISVIQWKLVWIRAWDSSHFVPWSDRFLLYPVVRAFHSFSVKFDMKRAFLTPWLKERRIHISNALVSTHGLKTREKFWPSIYLAWNDLNIEWSRMSRKLRPQTSDPKTHTSTNLENSDLKNSNPKKCHSKSEFVFFKTSSYHDYSNSLTLSNVGELITTISIACSRHSDSGERCEVKRSAKK